VKRDEKWSRVLLGFQLLVNACHVLIHHFALSLLWTGGPRPTALSEFLIYAGGLSCIAFVGIVGGQLQREQKSEDSRFPDSGRGKWRQGAFDCGLLRGGRCDSVSCAVGGWGGAGE